ncbi:MAG TPA: hypothetical protein VHF22_01105, partial [Planctomycetota bacterium]|nr:hypothetical protein [Planctomycetota bacterium]
MTSAPQPAKRRENLRPVLFLLFELALVLFAARSLDTARIQNNVFDEPGHIAAGMELLQYGKYEVDQLHPPLARVLAALPYYAAGARFETPPDSWTRAEDGARLLYDETAYWPALRAARSLFTIVALLFLAGFFDVARARLGAAGAIAALAVASVSPTL